MPRLIAKPALEVEPLHLAGVELALRDPGPLTLIAPFPGQEGALAAALAPLGLDFPAPAGVWVNGAGRLVWAGRGQALLMGVSAPEGISEWAAVTDQSDGWICLGLVGGRADQALSRLVGIDLRPQAFPAGRSARTALNHMPLILIREEDGDDGAGFLILTFRSMAKTAWTELSEVLHHLAARDRLPI